MREGKKGRNIQCPTLNFQCPSRRQQGTVLVLGVVCLGSVLNGANLRVMATLLRAKGPIHGIPEGWQLVAGGKRGTSAPPGSCRKETMHTGGVPAA